MAVEWARLVRASHPLQGKREMYWHCVHYLGLRARAIVSMSRRCRCRLHWGSWERLEVLLDRRNWSRLEDANRAGGRKPRYSRTR